MSPRFRVYSQTDVTGVELGGALKNIIAIGAGMGDGLEYGANAKAAFLTRGLSEITRLGVALGAVPATFMGLAGMGDLVATCVSPLSRNRRLGEAIARGIPLTVALSDLDQAAEGVEATSVALLLARRAGVEMPITETMARVLFEDLEPRVAVEQLMTRDPKEETLSTL
jgi:glycerol-3-phosphate dehydrogenase (NAD(P)+)